MTGKLIREGRMGLPKAFKTGAVVGTYPKPMLVLTFKREEMDVIPSRTIVLPADYVAINVRAEDMVFIEPTQLASYAVKPPGEQPPVLVVVFGGVTDQDPLAVDYKPVVNAAPMNALRDAINYLVRLGEKIPWQTLVLENLSDLSDIILQHISSVNPGAMNDARMWASMTGAKVVQVVAAAQMCQCHVITIMHSQVDKNELTGEINIVASMYSKVRDLLGKMFSAFFYATKENGKPVIYTTDRGYVKGIGARWPAGLPPTCQPDFKSIYGKELQ